MNLELYEHLTSLIKKKWEVSEGRVREKLLRLIGQIGREAKQAKSIEATLQVLWEVVSVIATTGHPHMISDGGGAIFYLFSYLPISNSPIYLKPFF